MRDGYHLTITNRLEDLPPWFKLHPTEVCDSFAYRMMAKVVLLAEAVAADVEKGPRGVVIGVVVATLAIACRGAIATMLVLIVYHGRLLLVPGVGRTTTAAMFSASAVQPV